MEPTDSMSHWMSREGTPVSDVCVCSRPPDVASEHAPFENRKKHQLGPTVTQTEGETETETERETYRERQTETETETETEREREREAERVSKETNLLM